MDTAKYLIGEVSKITGLSKDTIHFYVNSGLLAPRLCGREQRIPLLLPLEPLAVGHYHDLPQVEHPSGADQENPVFPR